MGQDKKVNVIHFVVKNTIDEEMFVEEEDSSDDGDVCENIEMREQLNQYQNSVSIKDTEDYKVEEVEKTEKSGKN